MSDLGPRVALITGSGRQRVGYVTAKYLARRGCSIAIHFHRSASTAAETVAELQGLGVAAAAFQADVRQEEEVDRLVSDVLARFGRLDILVTTSSIWQPTPLESMTAADFLDSFAVNTLGTFLCARRAGLEMVRQPTGGAIILLGDWAIERPYPGYAGYFAAKGAIPTLTRTLAVELAVRNPLVRVNCLHPGPVMFPPAADEQQRAQMVQATLVKQADCPDSIARAVGFLIDEPFVTGVCLPIDGGRTIFAGEPDSHGRRV